MMQVRQQLKWNAEKSSLSSYGRARHTGPGMRCRAGCACSESSITAGVLIDYARGYCRPGTWDVPTD
jgi:hypothetical protein